MNLEQLFKNVLMNQNRLKSKKAAKKFLSYQYEVLKIKKNKLKLGAVTFDIVQNVFEGFVLSQGVEMRYIRQDTSATDELKIENRLEALKWKWDYANVLAFLVILTFLIILFLAILYVWYCNNLPDFAFKDPKYDILVERSLKSVLLAPSNNLFKLTLFSNLFLVDAMIGVCSFFNVLF